jgi:hypothetical protein
VGRPQDLAAETVVHRGGGGSPANLRLSPIDQQQSPPGISVLLGGATQEAATAMRQPFPMSRKWQTGAQSVGSPTAVAVRQAGFDIVPDAASRFANHARLIHPNGVAGFTDENLAILSQAFSDTAGC